MGSASTYLASKRCPCSRPRNACCHPDPASSKILTQHTLDAMRSREFQLGLLPLLLGVNFNIRIMVSRSPPASASASLTTFLGAPLRGA